MVAIVAMVSVMVLLDAPVRTSPVVAVVVASLSLHTRIIADFNNSGFSSIPAFGSGYQRHSK